MNVQESRQDVETKAEKKISGYLLQVDTSSQKMKQIQAELLKKDELSETHSIWLCLKRATGRGVSSIISTSSN